MQIVVETILTQYFRRGKGASIVVLHGWGDTSQSWRAIVEALQDKYDVIVPDLPGFGGTEPPKEPWGLTDYAQFVRDFVQKLNIRPYAIIGHSNGGAIAIRGLGQGVLQADKLVLLASAGVRGEDRRTGLQVVAKIGKAMSRPLPQKTRAKLRSRLYQRAGSDLLVAEHLQDTFKRIVRDDVRADAVYLSLPTVLIYGELDTATPVRYGVKLQEGIEGSRLKVIPGVGHFLHVEAQPEVITEIQAFLQ